MLFENIRDVLWYGCEEIDRNHRMPGFVIVVAVTEIDPWLSNTAAAGIFDSGKTVTGNKNRLTTQAEI